LNINWLQKIVHILDKVGTFSRWINIAGISALLAVVIVNFFDVFLRYIFNRPLKGMTNITEILLITAVFLAVAHTHNEKGHIAIDLITSKLKAKARIMMEIITSLLGAGLFAIIIWRTSVQTLYLAQSNIMHGQFLSIPATPFSAVIVLGCTMLFLLLIRDILSNIVEAISLGLKRYHWVIMLIIPIIVLVLAGLWMQPDLWDLNLPTVGLIGVLFSLLFFMTGMPISFVLILTGFLFIGHIRGTPAAFDIIGTELYRTTGSYSWAVLATFVLMGFFCLHARFGEDLYRTTHRWVGHMPGGLAVATIGACTGFAAMVGDGLTATATMGAVSLPEMKRYKYDNRLSTGSILIGGSLGPIIPPSVTFIIFGILTQQSIGKLFIAGIIPGLLLAIAYILVIYIWCRFYPGFGPSAEKPPLKERLLSLRATAPVIILFVLVVGGIYAGVFTPSEGGSIGAVGAIVIGLSMKRWNWKSFSRSLQDGGKVISMAFLILCGAVMFTRFAAWCNLSGVITEFITGLGLSPNGVMVLILFIFFILGFVVDMMPLVLIGVPIVYPLAIAYGFDPIWFSVLVVLLINVGTVTPPVGISLFALKGVDRSMPMSIIYTGVLPFVLVTIIVVALIFIFPSLTTWLPSTIK
jgi:tripartite ATP-independent transporter DctM subunit